ncbi:hypothetical protein ADZ36_05470 [Streptomyces fradiae]|uniref:Uncharacterized protein n=2 Tax=Streptomyces TaxID=1883 RepID=A0A3R7LL53_9ACTN|nr:hypothetical protein ADZ36_05470 [Streptomyces fradiae]OFA36635.1 hypothetical protein BEN35_29710 [Streptomyces fradiae]PQM20633.1 hypothetical protein Sfr7A_25955 [Streptomyces xinghaiensis]RKM92574.1 hypothetical protein SFRA_024610 [Streptomyces xinghaiensis]RNC70542.1 hypothetical protein DC095_025600 [Streptomyces xinghaiensis]
MEEPAAGDPLPAGYRLAPCADLSTPDPITNVHGLYHAMDTAGMRIAAGAVRADPDGARQQLGLQAGKATDRPPR